jgi:molybdenum cofactor cytidylyltransferase
MTADPSGEDLPVIDPADVPPGGDQTVVGGLLLAAGTSSRFEAGNKLLATVDDEPLVWHAGLTLVQAGLEPRVAVVGRDAEAVEDALSGLGFEVVHNPHYADGQATSVRAGIDALGPVGAAVIALGDMPRVDPASVLALTAAYQAGEGTALAAADDGRRGNPVLFDREHFDALRNLDGDTGGRDVLRQSEGAALVETGDSGVRADVDTVADLEGLRDRWN